MSDLRAVSLAERHSALFHNSPPKNGIDSDVCWIDFGSSVVAPCILRVRLKDCTEYHARSLERFSVVLEITGSVRASDEIVGIRVNDMVVSRWIGPQTTNDSGDELLIRAVTDFSLPPRYSCIYREELLLEAKRSCGLKQRMSDGDAQAA